MSLSIVIPAWNSLPHLEPCLHSVLEQVGAERVLVVDNGSTDGSGELVERLGVAQLSLSRNLGFARAVNLGAARTGADEVLVLNADTVLEPGCVERLAQALGADPSLGGVQPRLLQADTDPPRLYSLGQELRRDGRAFEAGAGELAGDEPSEPREVFGVCGAACLLRGELFSDLGGYDERYFAFHEDVDLNARARLAGWRFAVVPAATVVHVGNAAWMSSADRPLEFNTRLVARNRLATDLKLMPLRSAPRIAVAEAGALVRSVRRRNLGAAVRGRLEALRWLPEVLRERRELRGRDSPARLDAWLG